MDIITIKLIEREFNIPLDVMRYLNDFIKYNEINDENIKAACEKFNDFVDKDGSVKNVRRKLVFNRITLKVNRWFQF